MPRVKRGVAARQKRNKLLGLAKGFYGTRSALIVTAREAVERAHKYSYRDRRKNKFLFRALWITRINAGARIHGLSYSRLMHQLKAKNVELDRKVLADMAAREPEAFAHLVKFVAV